MDAYRNLTRAGLFAGLILVLVMLLKAAQVQAPTIPKTQDACAYGMCKVEP